MWVMRDEERDITEPCLSCGKAYVEDIWGEWCCDEKKCLHKKEKALKVWHDSVKFNEIECSSELQEAISTAFKALEQEPILDKIRVEIDGAKMPKNRMCFFRDGIDCALQIIDKYKTGSED